MFYHVTFSQPDSTNTIDAIIDGCQIINGVMENECTAVSRIAKTLRVVGWNVKSRALWTYRGPEQIPMDVVAMENATMRTQNKFVGMVKSLLRV
jgi:hypothetical protein